MRILIKAKHVYAPGFPDADCLIVEDQNITWVGQYPAVKYLDLPIDKTIDAQEFFVAPGFVDSHVHLSATGAGLTGLNLLETKSASEALAKLSDYVSKSQDQFIIGHGWEDTHWLDAAMWNLQEVKRIIGDRYLYLSRIDVHSALVNTPSFHGIVKQEEHHQVRKFVQDYLPSEQRIRQIRAALELAASYGVVSVHENGGPFVSGEADFLDVLGMSQEDRLPQVFAYWGSTSLDEVKDLGAYGAAGDLTVDGSIGSMTAFVSQPYVGTDHTGTEFLTSEQIADHLVACTKAGLQGGFHAIGDAALENIIVGIKSAQKIVGKDTFRLAKHRIEHAEMLDTSHLEFLASTGVILSMQPVFDELWGNAAGLYEQRLGKNRSSQMNTFNAISKAGVTLAFSSDSPVTPINPWRAIKAATEHHTEQHRLSARAAFTAHTRGGWRGVKDENNGVIAPGLPANLAFWEVNQYTIKVPDSRLRAWSTDERSGTPPLPDLANELPTCVGTMRQGKSIFDPRGLLTA